MQSVIFIAFTGMYMYLPVGWEMTQVWTADSTMPLKGIVAFEYFSGNDKGEGYCKPDLHFRKALCTLTATQEVFLLTECERFDRSLQASYYDNTNSTNGRLNSILLMEEHPAMWVDYLLKQTTVGALSATGSSVETEIKPSEQTPVKSKSKSKSNGKVKKKK